MPYVEYSITKSRLALAVVLLDLVIIVAFFIFIRVLRLRQEEYIEEFQMQKIQMRDFTIRVKHLPNDLAYGDNEHVLKAHLMSHFEMILMHEEQGSRANAAQDPQAITRYEVADITFGKKDVDDTMKLVELHDYYHEFKRLKQVEIVKSKNPNMTNFSKGVRDAEKEYENKRK